MKRLLLVLLVALPLAAQQQQQRTAASLRTNPAGQEPDVVVDIPHVYVESVLLDVCDVRAHVSLDARVGNLVTLSAGADAGIDRVRLEINGVEAEVYLVVRLDKVAEIVERTLATIDRNPEIVTRLLDTVDKTVGTVGDVANTALQPGGVVSQTVGTVGRTLDNVTAPGGALSDREYPRPDGDAHDRHGRHAGRAHGGPHREARRREAARARARPANVDDDTAAFRCSKTTGAR